jgi:hypothetical protein
MLRILLFGCAGIILKDFEFEYTEYGKLYLAAINNVQKINSIFLTLKMRL